MKKYVSRFVRILLFLAGIAVIGLVLDYVITDDTEAQSRVTFHDFYEQDDVDVLFLGTSRSVYNINASKMTLDTGKSVYSLATVAQDFIDTYYTLKAATKEYDLDHVYFELSISRLYKEESDRVAVYVISDYLKSPIIRTQMLLNSVEPEEYINSFFRMRRNLDPMDLPDINSSQELLKKKRTKEYKEYLGTDNYNGRGQWMNSHALSQTGTAAFNMDSKWLDDFDPKDISEREWEYLEKIVELCKEEGVEITFYIAPYTEYYLMNFDKYQENIDLFYQLAEENHIDLIDFNLVKDEYLDFGVTDFINMDHITSLAGNRLADFFEMYMEDPSDRYFYNDLSEKYPWTDQILYAGYSNYFLSEKGEFERNDQSEGTLQTMRLVIQAISYVDVPVDTRLVRLVDVGTGQGWIEDEEIQGEKLNEYQTQFYVPYNGFQTTYRIRLMEPGTDNVLYETDTKFNME